MVEVALNTLAIDEIIILPCRQSPHKKGKKHASGQHRLAMCKLSVADIPSTRVDDIDLLAPEPCYSWRTAELMQQRYPDARLFWLMGSDQWQALPLWNKPEHLASLVEFIVFSRGSTPQPRPGYRLHSIKGCHPASATEIRESIDTSQHSVVKKWLHPEVFKYVKYHQLYLQK